MKDKVVAFLNVTIGSFITAIGFNTMLVHNNIASGGMVGISVVMKQLFGISPSLFLMLSNIPLLLLCYFFLGKQTFIKTLYGSWIYPIAIRLTNQFPTLTHNQFLAAIFGGIIVGIGLGMVFWGNSSTGGTGILTQILHKYSPLTLGIAMTIIDGISVLMGFLHFLQTMSCIPLLVFLLLDMLLVLWKMALIHQKILWSFQVNTKLLKNILQLLLIVELLKYQFVVAIQHPIK